MFAAIIGIGGGGGTSIICTAFAPIAPWGAQDYGVNPGFR